MYDAFEPTDVIVMPDDRGGELCIEVKCDDPYVFTAGEWDMLYVTGFPQTEWTLDADGRLLRQGQPVAGVFLRPFIRPVEETKRVPEERVYEPATAGPGLKPERDGLDLAALLSGRSAGELSIWGVRVGDSVESLHALAADETPESRVQRTYGRAQLSRDDGTLRWVVAAERPPAPGHGGNVARVDGELVVKDGLVRQIVVGRRLLAANEVRSAGVLAHLGSPSFVELSPYGVKRHGYPHLGLALSSHIADGSIESVELGDIEPRPHPENLFEFGGCVAPGCVVASLWRLDQRVVYAGLIEGVPNRWLNDHLLRRAVEATPEPRAVLAPRRVPPRDDAKESSLEQPERLPAVQCTGYFTGILGNSSTLHVLWYQDRLAFPIAEEAVARFQTLPWPALVREGED